MAITHEGGCEFCEVLMFNGKDPNRALDNLSEVGKVRSSPTGEPSDRT
jgi:hypothetical protein